MFYVCKFNTFISAILETFLIVASGFSGDAVLGLIPMHTNVLLPSIPNENLAVLSVLYEYIQFNFID